MKNNILQPGYVTVLSVIILGAITISTVISLISGGIMLTDNSQSAISAAQARGLANACAEEALQKIRDNTTYFGTFNQNFISGSCSSTVTILGLPNIVITSTGVANQSIKKINILIDQISPKIHISSWTEVADY